MEEAEWDVGRLRGVKLSAGRVCVCVGEGWVVGGARSVLKLVISTM